MKRGLFRKIVNVALVSLILTSSLTSNVKAESTDNTNSANTMTRNMINFFRTERTSLQVDRVARDELMVYGVFLSNFFVPWSTKINDIVDDSGDNSLPKQISKKFFGAPDRSAEVLEINKKLHEAITQVLGFDKKVFSMYASPPSDSSKAMSGNDFYNKMAGKDTDKKVYGSDGRVLLDLSDKATHASIQVLFGLSPEFMLSSDVGLRKLTGLYMDGLGNVWGSYDGADVGAYVLVLPASLNPVVFSKNPTSGKFPVTNVFSMGGTLKITSNFLQDADYRTPYYNLNNFFPNDSYNSNNVISIFGVQSPTSDFVGNTNKLINSGATSNPMNSIKAFLSQDSSSTFTNSEATVLLSVDATQIDGIDSYLTSNKNLTDAQKAKLASYLFKTTSFEMNELADDMYYFQVPLASAQNASDDSAGSFSEPGDMIAKQKLFARDDGSGNYNMYTNSFMSSPFNSFLSGYQSASDKNKYLKKFLVDNKISSDNEDFKRLKKFLDDGTWGNRTDSNIVDAMALLKKDNKLVYGLVEPANTDKIVKNKMLFEWIYSTFETTSFGLTKNDSSLTELSLASKRSADLTTDYKNALSKSPFEANNSGGTIKSSDKLTEKEVYSLSNYFYTSHVYRIFSMNSTVATQLTGKASGQGKYATPFGKELVNKTSIMNDINNYAGMYWGYMVQMLDVKLNSTGTGWDDITPYENEHLPPMNINTLGGTLDLNDALGTAGVVASEENMLEEMQKDIIKKVYGILSDGPNDHRDKLIKSTQDSWIVSTHRAITGSWIGNNLSVSAGGNGSYASVVGYINTPSLADLPLTNWLLGDYMYIYMLLLLVVLIVVILMVITNMRTLREGILILIVMLFVLLLPQFLVSNVINISNSVGDKIYSGRFNYWAITQHQQSASAGLSATTTGNELDVIIQKSMDSASNTNSSDVGVRVKWMSPKKDDIFDSLFDSNKTSQSLQSNLTIFRWLFASYGNQEEYVHNDPMATYLYRPYNAIAREALDSYTALSSKSVSKGDTLSKVASKSNTMQGLPDYRFELFRNPSSKIVYTSEQSSLIKSVKPISVAGGNEDYIENYRYWLLNYQDLNNAIFNTNYSGTNVGIASNPSNPYYNAFTLSTESPFYYFYNVLQHRYSQGNSELKTSLLNKEMFEVSSSNLEVDGTVRDFLDMEGLFTYVIPYLNQANEYVYGWTGENGSTVDGFDFNGQGIPDIEKDPELYAKYVAEQAKKENMKKVWKLYTPWVDQMYNLEVLNQKVRVADKGEYVEDTINPSSYEAIGRPMVFSEADMFAKNYRYSDLSDVERRIQATLDSTYEDLLYLTNYYDFDDDVLITAAAMSATFNFNREFSDPRILGEEVKLYPQNFELKNFNYDAFMRLTLLNSTGEPLMAEKDLYERILDKSSLFTGLLLIVCDILAVIVIPTAKVVVLLLLLFLSIMLSISCVITPPENIVKKVVKSLLMPSLMFLASSMVFALAVSLFMGEGLTGYVGGRTPSVGLSDPTVTMGLMVVVDCMFLVVLWKLTKLLLESLKLNGLSSFFGAIALATSAGSTILNKGTNKVKTIMSGTTRGVAGAISATAETASTISRNRQDEKAFNSLFDSDGSSGRGSVVKPTKDSKPVRSKDSFNGDTIDDLASTRRDSTLKTEKRTNGSNVDDKLKYIANQQRTANKKLDSLNKLGSRNIKLGRNVRRTVKGGNLGSLNIPKVKKKD